MFLHVQQYLLLKLLKARISRITFKLPANQIDIEEVNAIIRLIKIINSSNDKDYFTPDKALKRFWKYYDWRTFMEEKRHGNDIGNTTK